MALLGRMNEAKARKLHEELVADNFSALDCDLTFYSLIRGMSIRHKFETVLDYGAGRNRYAQDFDPSTDSYHLLNLRDLQHEGAKVFAVDVDPEVLTHPTSDVQKIIDPEKPLPFEDALFDLIVSDYVFEHIENPVLVARELQRVLKPGGWIVVRTPNRYGYLKFAASIVPNKAHNKALEHVQPHRKAVDTFPTYYRLNSRREFQRHFDKCEVNVMTDSWEPAYFFGRVWLYRLFLVIHKLIPRAFGTASIFILRKHDNGV